MNIVFWFSVVLIIYTMIGYPLLLELLSKVVKQKEINIDNNYRPSVTIIVPAHNEDTVIEDKINNLLAIDYNDELLTIIVTSDNSTDTTNNIVRSYEKKYPNRVLLHEVKERKGKTNAQDEAVKLAKGEIIVFTDANSMLKEDSVQELVSYMADPNIGYVTGKLTYVNTNENETSESEGSYWDIDLHMRQIESDIYSVTAGNGSLYAVKKDDYMQINPVYSHDSIFPPKFVISGKRAVYNKDAIAYEKAGETSTDEFSRKIRMSRKIIAINFVDSQKYNFFKFYWFTFFYVSHRLFRNCLYFFHLIAYMANFYLVFFNGNWLYYASFIVQSLIYLMYYLKQDLGNKYLRFILYYIMTIHAQLIGAWREITGKSKPFWEKAESTR